MFSITGRHQSPYIYLINALKNKNLFLLLTSILPLVFPGDEVSLKATYRKWLEWFKHGCHDML